MSWIGSFSLRPKPVTWRRILQVGVQVSLAFGVSYCSLCSGVQAQPAVARNGAAAGAAVPLSPGAVDLEQSRVYIKVGAVGLGHEHGVVGQLASGTLHLGAQQNAGRLVWDMRSLRADAPASRKYVGLAGETDASTIDQVNANMLGGSVLDVARFPTATLEVESCPFVGRAEKSGANVYQLSGKFTLHGVTKPIKITVQSEEAGNLQRVRGRFALRQTDHGIKPFSKLLGAVGVADELTIWGDLLVAPDRPVAKAGATGGLQK